MYKIFYIYCYIFILYLFYYTLHFNRNVIICNMLLQEFFIFYIYKCIFVYDIYVHKTLRNIYACIAYVLKYLYVYYAYYMYCIIKQNILYSLNI